MIPLLESAFNKYASVGEEGKEKKMSYKDFILSFVQDEKVAEELIQKGAFASLFTNEKNEEITLDFPDFVFLEGLARANRYELEQALKVYSFEGKLSLGKNLFFFFTDI